MTVAGEIQERAGRMKQRAALRNALALLGLAEMVPVDAPTVAGRDRTAFVRRVSGCTASAFRKGKVMPDGFTVTVCYGEESLLPRVLGWAASIRVSANYVFGFDRVVGARELPASVDSAFLRIDGRGLKKIVESLLHQAEKDSSRWPRDVLWIEEDLTSGVVFDEYAGTPHVPDGDDKRSFEVSAW